MSWAIWMISVPALLLCTTWKIARLRFMGWSVVSVIHVNSCDFFFCSPLSLPSPITVYSCTAPLTRSIEFGGPLPFLVTQCICKYFNCLGLWSSVGRLPLFISRGHLSMSLSLLSPILWFFFVDCVTSVFMGLTALFILISFLTAQCRLESAYFWNCFRRFWEICHDYPKRYMFWTFT